MGSIIILIIFIIALVALLSWHQKLPFVGKQIFTFFALALCLFSLTRGRFLLAVFWGLLALGNWAILQNQKRKVFQTKPSQTRLPSGCPPNCTGANLERAELAGINLRGANLSRANLSAANLYGANLSGADLTKANLFVANLEDIDLRGADLRGIDLGGANLRGADLRRADLGEADLRGAAYNDDTVWPTNFDPTQGGAIRRD